MKYFVQNVIISAILLVLTSCSDAVCIDADDFGFSQVKVPASYNSDAIHGSGAGQFVDWYDSGLTLSGNDVHVVVKNWDMLKNINSADELSAWCPWLGPSSNPPSMQDVCMMLDTCNFQGNNMCSEGEDAMILNAPCIFKRGVGLYMLIAPADFNPNASEVLNRLPQTDNRVIVRHLGEPTKDASGNAALFYDLQIDPAKNTSEYVQTGGAYVNLSAGQKIALTGGKLWFKILDKYYNDNSGQYIVTVKSGVTTTEWDPTAFAVDLVKSFFFGTQVGGSSIISANEKGVIVRIFDNIVKNPGYKLTVTSLLTLSIIFYAINFLIGNIKMTQYDLVIRIVKIIVISQLLTGTLAWSFFNDYLFSFFIFGTQSLINIIEDAGGTGPGPSSIISFMLAPHTLIKLFSLPLMSWPTFGWSLLYVLIYILALSVIFFGLFYAAVIYILSLTMMGLLIALAPIFLCFVLFDQTRSLFDNWLRQLMSYALQPLIVITGVTMFGLMIRHQIYQTLGFRVCKYYWMSDTTHPENALTRNIRGGDGRSSQPYYWKPLYATHNADDNSGEKLTNILLPEAHYQDGTGNQVSSYVSVNNPKATFCQAYGCQGKRYPSFPFLDPDNPADYELLKSFWKGNFAPVGSLAILLICGFLIQRFNMQATKIAQYISGGTFNISQPAAATKKDVESGVKSAVKGVKKGGKKAFKAGSEIDGQNLKSRGKAIAEKGMSGLSKISNKLRDPVKTSDKGESDTNKAQWKMNKKKSP